MYRPILVCKHRENGKRKKNTITINAIPVILMERFIRGTNLCILQGLRVLTYRNMFILQRHKWSHNGEMSKKLMLAISQSHLNN